MGRTWRKRSKLVAAKTQFAIILEDGSTDTVCAKRRGEGLVVFSIRA
jgi:hypothetical protein